MKQEKEKKRKQGRKGNNNILLIADPRNLLHWAHFIYFFPDTFTFQLPDKPWSQLTSLPPPGYCLQFLSRKGSAIPHCSSIFHRVLLTHALSRSASHFVHKKKSQRIYTSMHSAGLELTKLTYARLEDNLIRHRGDPIWVSSASMALGGEHKLKKSGRPHASFLRPLEGPQTPTR